MNATKIVSGGSAGGALAAAVVYVLSRFSVHLTAEDGALAAVGIVAVAAFVVHNGIRGVGRIVWRGASPSKADGAALVSRINDATAPPDAPT